MTINYTRLAAKAHAALMEAGQGVVYTRAIGGGDFDPATLQVASASTADVSIIVAAFDYAQNKVGQALNQQGAALVLQGDRQFFISPKDAAGNTLTWKPRAGDRLSVNAEIWAVVALEQDIAPAGTSVLFVVQGRKG